MFAMNEYQAANSKNDGCQNLGILGALSLYIQPTLGLKDTISNLFGTNNFELKSISIYLRHLRERDSQWMW